MIQKSTDNVVSFVNWVVQSTYDTTYEGLLYDLRVRKKGTYSKPSNIAVFDLSQLTLLVPDSPLSFSAWGLGDASYSVAIAPRGSSILVLLEGLKSVLLTLAFSYSLISFCGPSAS